MLDVRFTISLNRAFFSNY